MSETLILALVRLGAELGVNLFELLSKQGVVFTDEELRAAREATQAEVDRFHKLLNQLRALEAARRPDGV